MYCPNCGNYNDENAAFCGSCGTPLGQSQPARQTEAPDLRENAPVQCGEGGESGENSMIPSQKKGKKIWLILAAVLIVAAAAAAAVFLWILPGQKEKHYTALLAEGNRYLEEMDYEKAEDAYLEAIKIEPRKAEPYVKLADLYLDNREREKAVKIIADAKEILPDKEKEKIEILEEERKDELDGEGTAYVWAVEPEIEADDIYYLKETDIKKYPQNEAERQMFTDYAVIKQGDFYGLIDMDGEILGGMDYTEITSGSGYYLLKSKEPVYQPEYNWEMDSYYLYEDEIIPAVGIEGDVYGFKGAFYYCDGLQNIFDAYGEQAFGTKTWTEPEGAIPVKKSDITLEEALDNGVQDWSAWLEDLPGGYGIYCDGSMATDFVYDSCGSQVSGLLAVEQNGKWGYVDSRGNVVIPVEYDASWTQYVPQNGNGERRDFCYAASEGHVVLVKDGVWEMRDAGGGLTIDPGVFEEIRPMYDGKCWVKQDGRWGVIRLLDEEDSDPAEDSEKEEEAELSPDSSIEEIRDAVLEHLNESLEESGGTYSIEDSEMTESDTEYNFLLRYSISDEEAEKVIDAGGAPSANQLIGQVTVDRTSGTAVVEFMPDGESTWQLWKSEDTDGKNEGEFSEDELRSIASALRVPEDADTDIRVTGDPYYWEAGGLWLINVEIYQNGKFVAGASVDRDTKEPVKDIYTYNP